MNAAASWTPCTPGNLRAGPCSRLLMKLAAAFWQKRGHQIERAALRQPGHEVLSPLKFDDE